MNSARHLTISVVLAFLITVIGTVGYMMVEGWDFMDALYNLIVIAIEKSNGEMLFNPSFEARIEVEDTLIAVGEEPNLH